MHLFKRSSNRAYITVPFIDLQSELNLKMSRLSDIYNSQLHKPDEIIFNIQVLQEKRQDVEFNYLRKNTYLVNIS